MRDQYNRKINYMRISITDRCNLRCFYCMPEEGIIKKDRDAMMTLEEMAEVTKIAAKLGINKIRITGGEPLIKKGIEDFIASISSNKGIEDIAITTNGLLLKDYAKELKKAGLKRVNISIDSLKPNRYKEITRGGNVYKVLDGIQEALKLGIKPIKLNVVVIGGYNEEEIEEFIYLTKNDDIDVRFIELMPLGQAANWAKEKFISNEAIIERIGNLIPQEHQTSSPAKHFKLPGGRGRIGFINPISSHFCGECNRIRLTSDGKLKPCLHSNKEIDLLKVIRNTPNQLEGILLDTIKRKPEKHYLDTDDYELVTRNMAEIGG